MTKEAFVEVGSLMFHQAQGAAWQSNCVLNLAVPKSVAPRFRQAASRDAVALHQVLDHHAGAAVPVRDLLKGKTGTVT
jgi:hypothetical protein